jgi:two-component system alkaline phosphatase synthesis response regulator PhoP
MNRVLFVEDDELLGSVIRMNLESEGHEVVWIDRGDTALEVMDTQRFDLIVLDIGLPGIDGLALLERIRRSGSGIPVLMLTARSDVRTKVEALEVGADDYLCKPFDVAELLARVRALLRRSRAEREVPSDRVLRIGRYEVDLETREATTREGRTVLSEREVAILALLARSSGRPLSRHDILDEVWGMDVFPTERTVDNFLSRLRKLFEDDPRDPRHILTVRGLGYRLKP